MHEWVYGDELRRPGQGGNGGGAGGDVAGEEAVALQHVAFRGGDIAARLVQLRAGAILDGADLVRGPPSEETDEDGDDEDEEELDVE